MKINRLLFVLLLAAVSMTAAAQKISFHGEAPLTVVQGERFRVEYRLEGAQGGTFNAPVFAGCEVLSGPISASGSSTTIINGVQNSSVYDIYTYVLTAGTAPKITITPATVSVDGKKYTSNSLTISTVTSAAQSGSAASANPGDSRSNGSHLGANDVLLRMSLSKNNAYKGEAIVATLKLYMRVGVSNLQSPKYPTFNGFWTQELDLGTQQPTRETIGGKFYQAKAIRQWLIYPQKSGTLEVEQSSFKAVVQLVTQNQASSLFDNFFGSGPSVQNVERTITAPAVKVTVRDLPRAGAPAGEMAPVGQFTLTSQISGQQITANSAGSLTLTLSGTGDFPLIETPKFKLPAAFEQYDTKTKETLKNTTAGTNGSRTWEFPFIARSEGDYTLPAIEIVYFDPHSGTYKTLATPSYPIKVLRDPTGGKNSAAVVAGLTKEEVEVVGSDIRHIKLGDLHLGDKNNVVLFSAGYFVALAAVIILFFAAMVLLKKQIAARADVQGRQRRKASKVALLRLKTARTLLDKDDRATFFDETLRALWGYVSDKFAIPTSELNKQTIRRYLADRGTADTVADEFVALIERCEIARYAPATEVTMQDVYNEALTVIDKIS
ncbi:MAG: BatD family protein [Mucinivorans sp.]